MIDAIIVTAVVLLVLGVSAYLIWRKKKGKGGCGCGCSGCPNAGACGAKKTEEKEEDECTK